MPNTSKQAFNNLELASQLSKKVEQVKQVSNPTFSRTRHEDWIVICEVWYHPPKPIIKLVILLVWSTVKCKSVARTSFLIWWLKSDFPQKILRNLTVEPVITTGKNF